jgi:superfamily II DNA or RNA helicase
MDLSLDDEPIEWAQASLFTPLPPKPIREQPLAPGVKARDYGLRWYQEEAKDAVFRSLSEHQSCLVVKATGLGKSRLLAAIAGDWEGDVLVLAHRDELIRQNAATLEQITGEQVEIEQADQRASSRARIVMASVMTVKSKARMDRLGKDRFSLIITDEAHHGTSVSYRKVYDFYSSAKHLGVTATPDRSDEKALGQIFEDVAYCMDIREGIEAGYLVPIIGRHCDIAEVDISGVDTSNGDLVAGQLDEAMLKGVEGIVKQTLEHYPDRRGPCFFPGVKSAEFAAQRFNALRPGSAVFVSGKTPEDERREAVRDFKEGRYQYFCNVGIAIEGFDDPSSDMVVHGCPTKSRSRHAQMSGRGTRCLAKVDSVPGREGSQKRRALIASSAKPNTVLLDFVGNVGRHTLCSPEDLLGGSFTEEEVALAKKKAKAGGDVLQNLQAARDELRRVAMKAQSQVKATISTVDPFQLLDIPDGEDTVSLRFGYRPATEGQRAALLKMGLKEGDLSTVSRSSASKLLDERGRRIEQGLASFKQLRALSKYGITDKSLTFEAAKGAMDYIQGNGWKVQDPARLHDILYRETTR